MKIDYHALRLSQRYLVGYQVKGVHRKVHYFVARLIGVNRDDLVFDARPVAGTQSVWNRDLVSLELTNLPIQFEVTKAKVEQHKQWLRKQTPTNSEISRGN